MILSLLGDIVVSLLLIASIGYSIVLNRRLGALRADKSQLETVVRGLHDASVRAESGIAALRATADQAGRGLQHKIEAAQTLREDLAYMVDRGTGLADRLEGAIRGGRDEARGAAAPAGAAPRTAAAAPSGDAANTAGVADEPLSNRLRDLLRRADPTGPASSPDGDARITGFPSRAERDLRRALDGRL
jgi:Domain of unknown function (DUF6468)